MDMKINPKRIANERKCRAWSQQHLADVCDLSLRTVQRIEHSGKASLESTRSIAVCFGLQPRDLMAELPKRVNWLRAFRLRDGFAIFFVLVASYFYVSSALAESIMLNVSVTSDQSELASVQLLNNAGESSELRIDELLRVVLVSEMTQEQQIRISVEIYEYDSEKGYFLSSSPVLITGHKESARIKLQSSTGSVWNFAITPHL